MLLESRGAIRCMLQQRHSARLETHAHVIILYAVHRGRRQLEIMRVAWEVAESHTH